jgi:hypothetical protein
VLTFVGIVLFWAGFNTLVNKKRLIFETAILGFSVLLVGCGMLIASYLVP